MGIQKITFLLILLMVSGSTFLMAQSNEAAKKKVVIITKTKDADGKEVVKKIVKEGEEVSDEEMEKMINQELEGEGFKMKMKSGGEKEIEEEITVDENGKKTTTRRIKMKVNSDDVEIDEKEEHIVIMKSDDASKEMVKTKEIEIVTDGDTDETIDLGGGMELKIKGAKTQGGQTEKRKKKVKIIVEEQQ